MKLLNVLHVLGVLKVLNVLDMPKNALLAWWALFVIFFSFFVCQADEFCFSRWAYASLYQLPIGSSFVGIMLFNHGKEKTYLQTQKHKLGSYLHDFKTNQVRKTPLLRFWRKLKEPQNLSNWDFLAQLFRC